MSPSTFILTLALLPAPSKTQLVLHGTFLEGCSCEGTCKFETTGVNPGCHGSGIYKIAKGSFGGKDISGLQIVWVTAPGDKLYIYIDMPSESQSKTAKALAFTLFKEGFGKPQGVKPAHIKLEGDKGKFHLTVNGGKILDMTTAPVYGGDGKSLVRFDNVFGDPYDSLYQAKTVRATFDDGGQTFDLKESCSFFTNLKINKKI